MGGKDLPLSLPATLSRSAIESKGFDDVMGERVHTNHLCVAMNMMVTME